MRRKSGIAAIVAVLAWSGTATAHPHIFIDAGFSLVLDGNGQLSAIEVRWRYDELYSLILLEDYNLDPDFDLVLTEAEIAGTLGFDLNWGGGFEGGLVVTQDGAEVAVGPPEPVALTLLASGRIETIHRRPLTDVASGPLSVSIYDPEFYIAFEMILPVGVADAPDCTAELVRADLDRAYAVLEAALDEIGGVVAAEDNFPPVGAHFADRVEVTCPAS